MGIITVVDAEDVASRWRGRSTVSRGPSFHVGGNGFHAFDQPIRSLWPPVAGNQRPHDHLHTLVMHQFAKPRAAITERRTEPSWLFPSGLANGFAAAKQFDARFRGTTEKKIRMRVCMVAKKVAAIRNFFDESGRFTDVFAYDEESGLNVIAIKEIEKFRSNGRVGTVVEGDREFPRIAGTVNRAPEQLRARVHRAVGGKAGHASEERRNGDEPGIHRGYFATNWVTKV